jgi:hypothetical protein
LTKTGLGYILGDFLQTHWSPCWLLCKISSMMSQFIQSLLDNCVKGYTQRLF